MTFILTKRVTHGFMKKPVIQSCEIEASSFTHALKKLTLPTKIICDLRKHGRSEETDHRNATITLTLKEK
jgi:hypothetical protein